jgi:hypothetical protein
MGIRSPRAAQHISGLIRGSRWHMKRLERQHQAILLTCADYQEDPSPDKAAQLVRGSRGRRAPDLLFELPADGRHDGAPISSLAGSPPLANTQEEEEEKAVVH